MPTLSTSGLPTIDALGVLETPGWTIAMVALDEMVKSSSVEVIQVEWNDMLGAVVKFVGSVSHVQSALDSGLAIATRMNPRSVGTVINRPDQESLKAIVSPSEYNGLIEQNVVKFPHPLSTPTSPGESHLMANASTGQALGFIETQGFTAVFEAIDTACKAASVEVVGKEKLGGGFVTVVVRGDVAAVNAAIEAAKPRVEGLGKLIAAHVIARPSEAALSLLSK